MYPYTAYNRTVRGLVPEGYGTVTVKKCPYESRTFIRPLLYTVTVSSPSHPFPLPSPLFSWREKQNLDHPICECSITLGVAVLRESWDVAEGGLLDMLVAGGGAELC